MFYPIVVDGRLLLFVWLVASALAIIGLLAIWAGLSRRHWFVGAATLAAVIALLAAAPAFDLMLAFIVQSLMVMVPLRLARLVGRPAALASRYSREISRKLQIRPAAKISCSPQDWLHEGERELRERDLCRGSVRVVRCELGPRFVRPLPAIVEKRVRWLANARPAMLLALIKTRNDMSSLIVEVCEVKCVEPHPNAERMCVVTVRGWRVCAGRNPDTGQNQFAPGDKCVYLPPDSVVPPALGERLGVTKYLAPLPKNGEGVRAAGGRLRVASLRGVKSEGLVFSPDNAEWPVGTDVREYYGITKFEPPVKHVAGDAETPHPLFHRYYDMENLRNFPEMFTESEEVVITEKIHGQNVRLGAVWTEEDGGGRKIELMAGSHDVRRKPISASGKPCLFWGCAPECAWELVRSVAAETDQSVVLFGERFGSGVQDVHYGMHHGTVGFRAFDLTIGGKYLSADDKAVLFEKFGVPVVPELFRGPYSLTTVEALANGPTTLCDPLVAGKFGGREGVVVTAARERSASIADKFFDRAQAKLISFDYLARKGGTEYH